MSISGSAAPLGGPRSLERERESATIREALIGSARGAGAKVTVEGPSGIGKSRLLAEAAAFARESGMDVLVGSGSELERGYPFGLVSRILDARLMQASPAERETLLQGHARLASPLLLAGEQERRMATADAFELVHGLYWLMVNLGEQRPVALIVDDVQWGDDLSLRFLVYLADQLVELPIAVVVGLTTGDPDADREIVLRLADAGPTKSLTPSPLTLDAARELLPVDLLSDVTEEAQRDELVHAIWTATAGNPFLLDEVAEVMREEPERWSGTDASTITDLAPRSVARSVGVRLSRLGPDAVVLARACAVLGDRTPLRLASQLAGLELRAGMTAAERLSSARILVAPDPVSFAQPMVRAAVYDALPPGERPRLHSEAARILRDARAPDDLVADHVLAGGQGDAEWVTNALHHGARAAARKGAPEVAARFLRMALEIGPPSPAERARMLIGLGIIEAAGGDSTSLTRFEESLAILDDPPEEARALYALGETLYRYGRYDDAAVTFRRGAERFEDDDPDLQLRFMGAAACAGAFVMDSRDVALLESAARGIDARAPTSDAERAVLGVTALQRSMTDTTMVEAVTMARAALGGGALLRGESANRMASILAIIALVYAGNARAAQEEVDVVLADARSRGMSVAIAEASFARAMAMQSLGSVNDQIADAQAAVEATERGWHTFGPAPHAMLADGFIERGQLDEAERVLAEGEQYLLGPLNSWHFHVRGRLRLVRGQTREAFADFVAIENVLQPFGVCNPGVPPWRSLAGLAAHADGDVVTARHLISDQITMARDVRLPAVLGAALRAEALVEGGPVMFERLGESIAVLEDADAPLELARSLAELGAAHRREGRRVEARESLRRALALADQCGGLALEQRCREELLASGARPRRTALSGVESLTPGELRVAQLAAQGSTTRAMAEMLFLSKHTIEWHLRQIYRKLDVNNRDALRARFAAVGPTPDDD